MGHDKTYVLMIHIGYQLLSNDYYNDIIDLNPRRKLTCVIGAHCADGCAIISDTRETIGTEHRDVSKIRVLWNNKGAMAGAGDAPLISKIVETINTLSKNSYSDKIKDIDNNLRTVLEQYQPATMSSPFEAILMGLRDFDNGDPYIRLIDRRGFSTSIDKFEIIGIGHRYIRMLFKLLYDPRLKVNELAVLGYFCIATLISLDLDDNVGTGQLGPEVAVLNKNGLKLLNRDQLDPDFKTARASSNSLEFRNELGKSVWNQVPEAFKGG